MSGPGQLPPVPGVLGSFLSDVSAGFVPGSALVNVKHATLPALLHELCPEDVQSGLASPDAVLRASNALARTQSLPIPAPQESMPQGSSADVRRSGSYGVVLALEQNLGSPLAANVAFSTDAIPDTSDGCNVLKQDGGATQEEAPASSPPAKAAKRISTAKPRSASKAKRGATSRSQDSKTQGDSEADRTASLLKLFESLRESLRSSEDGNAERMLPQLRSELIAAKNDGQLGSVPGKVLVSLMQDLVPHVRRAMESPEEVGGGGAASSAAGAESANLDLNDVSHSLLACSTALAVMAAPESQQACVVHEMVDASLHLLRLALARIVLPSLDPTHVHARAEDSASAAAAAELTGDSKAAKTTAQVASACSGQVCEMLRSWEEIMQHKMLDDATLFTLTDVVSPILFAPQAGRVARYAVPIISLAFSRYPNHRNAILDDTLSSLGRLDVPRKKSRGGAPVRVEDVQPITLLLVSMVQASAEVVAPSAGDVPVDATDADGDLRAASTRQQDADGRTSGEHGGDDDAGGAAVDGRDPDADADTDVRHDGAHVAGFGRATQCAGAIANSLQQLALMPKEDGDFPLWIPEMILSDAVSLLCDPAWPGAHALLQCVCVALARSFAATSGKRELQPQRAKIVDILGSVAANLARAQQSHEQARSKAVVERIVRDFVLQSDAGKRKQNGAADAGDRASEVSADDTGDRTFFCDTARAVLADWQTAMELHGEPSPAKKRRVSTGAEKRRQSKRANVQQQESAADAIAQDFVPTLPREPSKVIDLVVREVWRRALRSIVGASESRAWLRESTILFLAAESNADSDGALYSSVVAERKRLIEYSRADRARLDMEPDAIAAAGRTAACAYLSCSSLARMLDQLLEFILRGTGEAFPAVRSKATRNLANILDEDRSLLQHARVEEAIRCRLLDHSALVREATIELVGRHLVSDQNLIPLYLDTILGRVLDTAVSVRKRALRVLRALLLAYPNHARAADVCVRLAGRIADEDSIRKLVVQTIRELWFSAGSHGVASPSKGGARAGEDAGGAVLSLEACTRQMALVVDALPDTGWFERMLLNVLFPPKANQASERARSVCVAVVERIVQEILASDEEVARAGAPKRQSTGARGSASDGSPSRPSLFKTMFVLASVDPQLVVPHAEMLIPYLRDPREAAMSVYYATGVLERALPAASDASQRVLAECQRDVVALVMKHGQQKVVEGAVKCLCRLSRVAGDFELVQSLVKRFYGFLQSASARGYPRESMASTLRALFSLGALCRYTAATVCAQPSIAQAYALLGACARHENLQVRLRAVQGLCLLFSGHPDLLTDASDLIHTLLGDDQDPRIRTECLRGLAEFFHDLERRITLLQAGDDDDEVLPHSSAASAAAAPGGDADGTERSDATEADSGAASALAQAHLDEILGALFATDVPSRLAALHLVGCCLKQGVIHPMSIAAPLLALLADRDARVVSYATSLLRIVETKGESYVFTQLRDGVLQSFVFQQKVYGNVRVSPRSSSEESPYSAMYGLLRDSRKFRLQFLRKLTDMVDASRAKSPGDVQQLVLVGALLASLPLSLLEECLSILKSISRTLSVSAESVLAAMRGHVEVSRVDGGKKSYVVTSQSEAKRKVLRVDAYRCASMVVLVQLKAYLKLAYNISESKIESAAANEATPKRAERTPVRRNPQIPPFPQNSFVARVDVDEDEDVVRLYAMLRKLLKRDGEDLPLTAQALQVLHLADKSVALEDSADSPDVRSPPPPQQQAQQSGRRMKRRSPQ